MLALPACPPRPAGFLCSSSPSLAIAGPCSWLSHPVGTGRPLRAVRFPGEAGQSQCGHGPGREACREGLVTQCPVPPRWTHPSARGGGKRGAAHPGRSGPLPPPTHSLRTLGLPEGAPREEAEEAGGSGSCLRRVPHLSPGASSPQLPPTDSGGRGHAPGRGEASATTGPGPPGPTVCRGADPLARTPSSGLQSRRARIHQQIGKELRVRAGAENLYRATSNSRVRATVALELSFVNSNLQLLKEELEGLGRPDEDQPEGEGVSVPMIPLGLKETKELDWATPLKELISEHFGEDGTSYAAEILELERLRQATRTPSRDEAGPELLAAYYSQLCFLDARFFSAAPGPGLLFHWYDSLTGIPAQQRALAFEKGSVLFNIGALHTQIGARQDRSCAEGASRAVQAFGRAAGAFRVLRENFSHAPSPDMSAPCLCALEQLMRAQAQECVFEGLLLPAPAAPRPGAQLRLAQEAAQVAADYGLVHRAMTQTPVQDFVPASWATLVQVKAEHFRALAHHHAALALCAGSPAAEGEVPAHEQVFQPPGPGERQGPPLPQQPEERRKLAKAHLKRAILGQEEALRLHALCRVPRAVDLLRAAVAQALRRSLARYSELEREDDFCEAKEAPSVQPKTCHKPEVGIPSLNQTKAADIFQRLGPLPVFSTRNRWRLVGPVHLTRGEGGFGFTLRGDAPVLIAAVVPGGQAAVAGLREGDYIVSVNGQPCRWWEHAQVVAQLRDAGEAGASLQVVSPLPSPEPRGTAGPGGLLRSQRECGFQTPAPVRAGPRPFLGWSRKAKRGKAGGRPPPAPAGTVASAPEPGALSAQAI